MFNFKADYSNNEGSSFDPLPTGNYECIIQNVHEKVTKNNKESLSFKLVVRNDLDQALPETNGAFHNRILFDDHWKRDVDGQYIYVMKNLMYVMEAVGIKEGTEINGVDQLIDLLIGKPVKVYTKVEPNTYNGVTTDQNNIAPWGYSKSDYPNVQHVWKDKKEAPLTAEDNPFTGTEGADIPEEDYPF